MAFLALLPIITAIQVGNKEALFSPSEVLEPISDGHGGIRFDFKREELEQINQGIIDTSA